MTAHAGGVGRLRRSLSPPGGAAPRRAGRQYNLKSPPALALESSPADDSLGVTRQRPRAATATPTPVDTMTTESSHKQPFLIERHGDIAVITPSPDVEKLPDNLMEQAAQ